MNTAPFVKWFTAQIVRGCGAEVLAYDRVPARDWAAGHNVRYVDFEDLSGQMLPDDELSLLPNSPNVLITAHQGFLTHEPLSEIPRVTTTTLLRLGTCEAILSGTALDKPGATVEATRKATVQSEVGAHAS